jgi:hypothetical protein
MEFQAGAELVSSLHCSSSSATGVRERTHLDLLYRMRMVRYYWTEDETSLRVVILTSYVPDPEVYRIFAPAKPFLLAEF